MDFFLYILKCSDSSYYIGHTDNIEQRVAGHNDKKFEGYTASRLPVELVFVQNFTMREDAIAMEVKIKKWTRIKKEALMNSDYNQLKLLSKKLF